jgi:hypothetical protein
MTMTRSKRTAEEIQARMREVRSNVDAEVERFVEAAREMTDWRHYVRKLPWLCVGAAVAVGYLCVRPKKTRPSPDTREHVESASQPRFAAVPDQPAKRTESFALSLIRIAAPIVVKVGIAAIERRMVASGKRPGSQPAGDPERSGDPSASTNVR